MSELQSTIQINDGFTEPLKNLTKEVLEATGYVKKLSESLRETTDEFDKTAIKSYASSAALSASQPILKSISKAMSGDMSKALDKVVQKIKVQGLAMELSALKFKEAAKIQMLAIELSALKFKDAVKSRAIYIANEIKDMKRYQDSISKFMKDKTLAFKIQSAALQKKVLDEVLTMRIATANFVNTVKMKIPEVKKLVSDIASNVLPVIKRNMTIMYLHFSFGLEHIKDVLREKSAIFKANFKDIAFNAELSARGIMASMKSQSAILKSRLGEQLFNLRLSAEGFAGTLKAKLAGFRAYAKGIDLSSTGIKNALAKLGFSFKMLGKDIADGLSKRLPDVLSKLKSFEKSLKSGFDGLLKIGRSFARSFITSIATDFVFSLTKKLTKKLAEGVKSSANALRDTINNSLDEINLQDKLKVNYGEDGVSAESRAFRMAQDMGESATMIGEMSIKAAQQGIGTDDFERTMRLADRIGKIKLGETTENVANSLISNLKSGHDASQIAELFGGGDVMARNIKWRGFERALDRGNLSKALSIAEQIADESGYTLEKYEQAGNTMSQNFKRIENTIDNIKKRIGLVYSQSFEPIVSRISKILQGENFKKLEVKIIAITSVIGKVINYFANGLVDMFEFIVNHCNLIVGIIGGAMLVKSVMFIKHIGGMISLFKTLGTIILGIAKIIHLDVVVKGMLSWIRHLTIAHAKSVAIAAVKVAGPWILAIAAIAGVVKGMSALLNSNAESEEDKTSVIGVITGTLSVIKDILSNIFVGVTDIVAKLFGGQTTREKYADLAQKYQAMAEEFLPVAANAEELYNKTGDKRAKKIFIETMGLYSGYDRMARKFLDMAKNPYKSSAEIMRDYEKGLKVNTLEGMAEQLIPSDILNEMLGFVKDIEKSLGLVVDEGKGIKGDTDKIRKFNEQEEELRWMKAFSDRQIMQSINTSTSMSRNVNIYGMSEQGKAQMARMNVNRFPGNAAAI